MIFVQTGDDLSQILSSAPPGEQIILPEGVFSAKILLKTPNLTLTGAGMDKTVIRWADYAKKPDPRGLPLLTFRSWTLAVCGDHVTFRDLAVENAAGRPEIKGQQVALTVYGDDFTAERCRFTSTQDTLFLGPLPDDLILRYTGYLPDELRAARPCRQAFRDCLMEGTVDFIFGCGEARFENCEIRSLSDARNRGYAAAPSHEARQGSGFFFHNCRFTQAEGVKPGSVYLARPWRDYGMCVFKDCRMGTHISPLGYDKWDGTHRDGTARFYESPLPPGRVPWARSWTE